MKWKVLWYALRLWADAVKDSSGCWVLSSFLFLNIPTSSLAKTAVAISHESIRRYAHQRSLAAQCSTSQPSILSRSVNHTRTAWAWVLPTEYSAIESAIAYVAVLDCTVASGSLPRFLTSMRHSHICPAAANFYHRATWTE